MADGQEKGVPYPSSEADPIDEWSEQIYVEFRDWAAAKTGEWTRWEPGYLLLTINNFAGRAVEPITLYTADGELCIEFGHWSTLGPNDLWDAEADVIARYAKQLIDGWLSEELRTAVLTDAAGKWCGSSLIKQEDLEPQLRSAAMSARDWHPKTVEVRSLKRDDWKTFDVDAKWLEPEE